jgi:tetratricopeptide (TPR) repeat protein
MRIVILALLCLLAVAIPDDARAHAVSNSYLELTTASEQVSGHWRVALRDLDGALGLDQDADGRIDDTELSEARPAIEGYLLSRLELAGAQGSCRLSPSALRTSGSHVVLELASRVCAGPLSLRYDLFFEHDRSHQGHLHVAGAQPFDTIFTSERRSVALAQGTRAGSALLQYLGQGVWHILIGADHVLFLLTLLIGAVLRFDAGRHVPVDSFRRAFVGMAKIVTAFTAAHSLTLSAMALGFVALPSRWVETAIAVSIVAAAANNLWPVVTRRTWLLAFAFGLIHGLGFAGVLLDLGLPQGHLLVALLGFNLGVELGQLGIVALCFPIAFWLRRRAGYRRYGLALGSLLVGAIGLVWSLERALDVEWTARLFADGEASAAASTSEKQQAGSIGHAVSADGLRADALVQLAEEMASEERWADVYRLYEEARTLHERAGDTRGLARDLSRLGDVLVSAADPSAARRMYDKALALHEQLGDFTNVALQYRNLAIVARLDADAPAAAQMYRRALDLHRRHGHQHDVAADLAALARTHLGMGEYVEAKALYEQANVLERELGRTRLLAKNYNQLGNLHVLQDDLVPAEKMYRQALSFSEQASDSTEAANNWANLAGVSRKQGQLAEARQRYEKSLSLFEQSGAKSKALRVRSLLASLEQPSGGTLRQ